MKSIGILHPGEMGVSVAASVVKGGHKVYWSSKKRSEKTSTRAAQQELIDTRTLAKLCRICEIIISVCPPHAAEEVAKQVIDCGFKGIYLDANAIAPQRVIKIGQMMESSGIDFVDGGIIGGPAWQPKETWLYLSGKSAELFKNIFSGGMLETRVIGEDIGRASALKMCYAAYSKGTTALLCAVLGTAEFLGVRAELNQQWEIDETGFSEQVNRRVSRVTAKAWRFEGEMKEIASTFLAAGLPDGFHQAAAEVYHRLANFKDAREAPPPEYVLEALLST